MMNKNNFRHSIVMVLLLAVSLGGCVMNDSPVRNHQKDYLHAKGIPPLSVPANVTLDGVKDRYPLPKTTAKFTCQPSLIPPGNPGAAK
ncbi:MAG: hypothetical protein GY821_08660 [Gammaproteobacteria bacterium]|nr:hypothetical protein [Gammaproteobacteria bacterium]